MTPRATMRRLFANQVTVSAWPFLVLLPVETIFLINFRQRQLGDLTAQVALTTVLFMLLSVALAALAAAAWNHIALRRRWARTIAGSLVGYAVVTSVSSLAILMSGPFLWGAFEAPLPYVLLVPISRYPTIVLLAAIIDQVTDGLRARRELNGELASRLLQVRRMNELLESAQRQVATDSARRLRVDVQQPLRVLVARSKDLSNEDLADELEGFIDHRLRPLAHRLHPVSVRLGLIAALRSLDPDMVIDVSDAIERLDVNGELLDDDVRLQVYRWVRQCREEGHASRIALVMRSRNLEVSAYPLRLAPLLDPIQITAGLRSSGRGVVVAPLRGQSSRVVDIENVRAESEPARAGISWAEVLTTPLPGYLGVVALLSLSSLLAQLLIVPWPLTSGALATATAWVMAPLLVAAVFTLLPNPPRTPGGAVWAVGQWFLLSLSAAVAFQLTADMANLGETLTDSPGLGLFRGIYRYLIPGMALVIAYGIQVALHHQIDDANERLDGEIGRQAVILAEARRLDQDVAEALHRNVQGRLAAAVVMIRLGHRIEGWVQVATMADQEVPNLISRVDEASSREDSLLSSPPEGLEVREVVRVNVAPPDLLADLQRAVSEIAVNAVRHGGASRLEIEVVQNGETLVVTCRDNGRGARDFHAPGLGSRLLDEIAERWHGRWSLSTTSNGCVVEMEFVPSSATAVAAAARP